jgi:hypothetical protein
MTPFTNGRSKLIASEENSAAMRLPAGRDVSKMARVAICGRRCGGCTGRGPEDRRGSGDVVPDRSGKDIDGREEMVEGISSHFWEPDNFTSSVVSRCSNG